MASGPRSAASDTEFKWVCPLEGPSPAKLAAFKRAKRAAVGEPVGVHYGGLSKRHFTWSITRNYKGYTPDSISDGDVEQQIETALSAWASVTNLSFTRVSTGGEVTFEWVDDLQLGIPNAVAVTDSRDSSGRGGGVLPEAFGATILFAAVTHDAGGNEIKVNWAKPGRILQLATHEVGHFLGMWHAFDDTGYGNLANASCYRCQCDHCEFPKPNDPSIMSYDYKCSDTNCMSYLSAYDISVIQRKYGPNPYGVPLIELWIPGWGKHFYTTSWPEANALSWKGFAQGVARLWGMFYKDSLSGTVPLYRYYSEEPGVGPRHYYSVGKKLCGPQPLWYEGLMGFLKGPKEKQGPQDLRLYNHYSSARHDNVLTSSSKPPAGYSYRNIFGHVIPLGNFPVASGN